MKQTILLGTYQEIVKRILKFRLEKENFNVEVASDGYMAKRIIENKNIQLDCIVAEEYLPYYSGFELIKQANERTTPIIIISDDLDDKIVEAFKLGADDFIYRPFSIDELILRIKNCLKHYNNCK